MDRFLAYFREIGMTPVAINRVISMVEEVVKLYPATIEGVFVSDSSDNQGNRTYDNLWIFTDEFWSELKNFMIQVNFDFISKETVFSYVDITYANYSSNNISANARI